MSEKKQLILKAVGLVFGVVFILSLFITIMKVTNSTNVVNLTGGDLLFGKTYQRAINGIAKTIPSWQTIIYYLLSLFALAASALTLKFKCKALDITALLLYVAVALLSWFKADFLLDATYYYGIASETTFGYIVSIAATCALAVRGILFFQGMEVKEALKYLIFGFAIIGFLTFMSNIAGAEMVISETHLNRTFYLGTDILFKGVTYNNQAVYSFYSYIAYMALVIGAVVLFFDTNPKLKYLISSCLFLVGIVFFILGGVLMFEAVNSSKYYFAIIGTGTIVAIISSGLAFLSSLYLAAVTPVKK